MDAGKLFVLILTAFSLGILFYLEMRARRMRSQRVDEDQSLEKKSSEKTPA